MDTEIEPIKIFSNLILSAADENFESPGLTTNKEIVFTSGVDILRKQRVN